MPAKSFANAYPSIYLINTKLFLSAWREATGKSFSPTHSGELLFVLKRGDFAKGLKYAQIT